MSKSVRVRGMNSRFKDLQDSQNMEPQTEYLGLSPSQEVMFELGRGDATGSGGSFGSRGESDGNEVGWKIRETRNGREGGVALWSSQAG